MGPELKCLPANGASQIYLGNNHSPLLRLHKIHVLFRFSMIHAKNGEWTDRITKIKHILKTMRLASPSCCFRWSTKVPERLPSQSPFPTVVYLIDNDPFALLRDPFQLHVMFRNLFEVSDAVNRFISCSASGFRCFHLLIMLDQQLLRPNLAKFN